MRRSDRLIIYPGHQPAMERLARACCVRPSLDTDFGLAEGAELMQAAVVRIIEGPAELLMDQDRYFTSIARSP